MIINDDVIEFEYLSATSYSVVGDVQPLSAKIKTASSFASSNAPGVAKNLELQQIESLGRAAVESFNKMFA